MSKVIQNKGGIGVGAPYDLPGYEYDPVTDKFKDLATGKSFDKDGGAKLEDNKAFTVDTNGTIIVNPSATYDGMKKVTLSVNVAGGDLENNKDATIDVSAYTEPVEVTPTAGKDGMKKVTVSLSNIPSGGATTPLYAWKNSDDGVAYTLTPTPKTGDFAFYQFNLTTKASNDSFGIWNTDGSSYITFDETTFERDSSLDVTISGPAWFSIFSDAVLPVGQKLYVGKYPPIYIDTDGEHTITELFNTSDWGAIYAGTMGNVHFFTPYSG